MFLESESKVIEEARRAFREQAAAAAPAQDSTEA